MWWGVRRLGVRLSLSWPQTDRRREADADPGHPRRLAGGALQMNSVVSQVLTGSDEGARSVLYNADRLYQLPLGLVGVAIGLALVPRLTQAFVSGDHEGGRRTLDDGITLAMAFTLPAAVALFVIPFFIIDATVTRGAFTSQDAARTADVLRQFAWGVPAFVLAKVLTPPVLRARGHAPADDLRRHLGGRDGRAGRRACSSGSAGSASTACWAWPSPPASRPGSTSPCWAGP